MRRGIFVLGAALVLWAVPLSVSAADVYRVNIRRIDQDLYRTQTRLLIKTRYCYEYVYGEDAILVWDGPYSGDNKLVFDSGSSCDVEGVYR